MTTQPRLMTAADLTNVMVKVLESFDDDDPRAAAAAIDFDPCRANVGMLVRALAAAAGAFTRSAAANRDPSGEVFAVPVFSDATSESDRFVGRMLACAVNDDKETLDALVEAFLDQDHMPPSLMADVLLGLTFALRVVYLEARGGAR